MTECGVNRVALSMPRLGETMERGMVADWLVKEGEAFKRGDAIVEFETDKTAVEYPALGDGVLLQQLVKPGDQVEVGEAIAWIDIGDGPDWVSEKPDTKNRLNESASTGSNANEPARNERVGTRDWQSDATQPDILDRPSDSAPDNTAIRATPVARKLARLHGIALTALSGTGRRGRIEAHDVEARAAGQRPLAYSADAIDSADWMGASIETDLQFTDGIAYRVSGPTSGVPVLMLHGFAADASAWGLISRRLAKSGCRVLTVDLPGHGATTIEAPNVDSLFKGLQNVLAANYVDAQSWHVVAHSLGTMPCLRLAQSDTAGSIGSLTLIAPVGLGLSIDRQFINGMAKPSSVAELSHLLRRLSNQPSTLSDSAVEALYDQLKQGRLQSLAQSILGTQGQALDCHEAIRKLSRQLPVKVLVGHADRIIDWQDVLSIAPSVAVHHFPTAGHMPHWDYPEEVSQIILAGLTKSEHAI